MRRWTIRLGSSLIGIAAGLLLADLLLDRLSLSLGALLAATLVFWGVHFLVQLVALRTLLRQPSVALAGLLALASTVVALVIVNLIVSGMSVRGPETYVFAALIIWVTTALADTVAARQIRDERRD